MLIWINKMQIRFDERGCKGFFKKCNKHVPLIKELIEKAIIKEIATGMSKVKLASRKRINGQKIYEFRLNLSTLGSARIAFSIFDDQAIVYFISKDIQKSSFSKEFEKIINKRG